MAVSVAGPGASPRRPTHKAAAICRLMVPNFPMNGPRHRSSPPIGSKGSAPWLNPRNLLRSRRDYDSAKINEGSHEVSPHLDQTSPLSRTTPEGAHATADLSRSWRASDSCESAVLALVERIQPPFPRIIGPPLAFAVSNCLLWPLLNRFSPVRRCRLGSIPGARFRVSVCFQTPTHANHAPFRGGVE